MKFYVSRRQSEILHFGGSLLSKSFKVSTKKNTEELSHMTLNSDAKFESTLTLWFLKWHGELGELSLEHSKGFLLFYLTLFLPERYNAFTRKFHRNSVLLH